MPPAVMNSGLNAVSTAPTSAGGGALPPLGDTKRRFDDADDGDDDVLADGAGKNLGDDNERGFQDDEHEVRATVRLGGQRQR